MTLENILPEQDALELTSENKIFKDELERRKKIEAALAKKIAEHEASEKLLIESERVKNLFLDATSDCVKLLDRDSVIIFMNKSGLKSLGVKDFSEIKGRKWTEYWTENEKSLAENAFDMALMGVASEFIGSIPGSDFRPESWWHVQLSPIIGADRQISQVLAISRDISGQKNAEKQIQERIAELKRTQDALKDSISALNTVNMLGRNISAELDLEKLVQKITDTATHLAKAKFGALFYNVENEKGECYTLYSLSGAPKEAFSHFPMPRKTNVFASTFDGTGIVRSDDITQDPRYGKNAPYYGMPKGHFTVKSYLAVPVISRSQEVIGGLFFGHPEIGVFSEKEESLVSGIAAQAAIAIDNARLYQKSKEAIRARDTFLSIASHELKTPLTSLKLQIQLRKRSIEKGDFGRFSTDKLPRMIEDDERQIDRLIRLVDDMLDISKIQTGKLSLEFETFDLCSLVKDLIERFSVLIKESKSSVIVEGCPAVGKWDRYRIEQIVTNLLTNAIKYGEGRPISILVSLTRNIARLSVTDQGIGIAKEDHERIFDQFERAVSSTSVSGFGLGLFIVKQLVESHHGRVFVESEKGKGSIFTVELPCERI